MMKRDVLTEDLKRLYTSNDMVKADCGGCVGCSSCCCGMGRSVVLDPLDVFCLKQEREKNFGELLSESLELNVVDGIILPNLKMKGDKEACFYLDDEGRCSIHKNRPGVCRLFPLGRYYENGTFHYFLQSRECVNEQRSKIKVSKWIQVPNLKEYENFVCSWHYFLEETEELLEEKKDEQLRKDFNRYILETFYVRSYEGNFYETFANRLLQVKKLAKVLKGA